MGLSTPITNVVLVFDQNDSCSLRSGVTVTKMNIKTGKFDFETISAIETVLWENVTKRYQKQFGILMKTICLCSFSIITIIFMFLFVF